MEEWKDIKGYEGLYQVSNEGRVKSLERILTQKTKSGYFITKKYPGKILKPSYDRDGYVIVTLNRRDGGKTKKVHKLVAEAFIPNPENKPVVGHLKTMDNGLEDKTANEAWNLAWMTEKENANYGTIIERKKEYTKVLYKNGRMKRVWKGKKRPEHSKAMSIPIIEIKEDGSVVEWESTIKCAEAYGVSPTHLSNAVNGHNHKRGHYFKTSQFYKKEDYEKMVGKTIIVPPTIL